MTKILWPKNQKDYLDRVHSLINRDAVTGVVAPAPELNPQETSFEDPLGDSHPSTENPNDEISPSYTFDTEVFRKIEGTSASSIGGVQTKWTQPEDEQPLLGAHFPTIDSRHSNPHSESRSDTSLPVRTNLETGSGPPGVSPRPSTQDPGDNDILVEPESIDNGSIRSSIDLCDDFFEGDNFSVEEPLFPSERIDLAILAAVNTATGNSPHGSESYDWSELIQEPPFESVPREREEYVAFWYNAIEAEITQQLQTDCITFSATRIEFEETRNPKQISCEIEEEKMKSGQWGAIKITFYNDGAHSMNIYSSMKQGTRWVFDRTLGDGCEIMDAITNCIIVLFPSVVPSTRALNSLKTLLESDSDVLDVMSVPQNYYFNPTTAVDHIDAVSAATITDKALQKEKSILIIGSLTHMVHSMLESKIAVIHGPPGCGKTRLAVGICSSICKSKMADRATRILCVGPSNGACLGMAYRLEKAGLRVIKFLSETHRKSQKNADPLDFWSIVADIARIKPSSDCATLLKLDKDRVNTRITPQKKKKAKEEFMTKLSEVISILILNADVVVSTVSNSGMINAIFSVILIDEASQLTEGHAAVPLKLLNHKSTKIILIGDHMQMRPHVMLGYKNGNNTTDPALGERLRPLEISLFERIVRLVGEEDVAMLDTTYRPHPEIMWPWDESYSSQICCEGPTEARWDFPFRCLWITCEGSTTGSSSQTEANIAREIYRLGAACGVPVEDFLFLTPFRKQQDLLRRNLPDGALVHTLAACEGMENQLVVISSAIAKGKKPFSLSFNPRQALVGLTRAQAGLIIIGDPEAFKKGPLGNTWTKLHSFLEGTNRTFGYTGEGCMHDHFFTKGKAAVTPIAGREITSKGVLKTPINLTRFIVTKGKPGQMINPVGIGAALPSGNPGDLPPDPLQVPDSKPAKLVFIGDHAQMLPYQSRISGHPGPDLISGPMYYPSARSPLSPGPPLVPNCEPPLSPGPSVIPRTLGPAGGGNHGATTRGASGENRSKSPVDRGRIEGAIGPPPDEPFSKFLGDDSMILDRAVSLPVKYCSVITEPSKNPRALPQQGRAQGEPQQGFKIGRQPHPLGGNFPTDFSEINKNIRVPTKDADPTTSYTTPSIGTPCPEDDAPSFEPKTNPPELTLGTPVSSAVSPGGNGQEGTPNGRRTTSFHTGKSDSSGSRSPIGPESRDADNTKPLTLPFPSLGGDSSDKGLGRQRSSLGRLYSPARDSSPSRNFDRGPKNVPLGGTPTRIKNHETPSGAQRIGSKIVGLSRVSHGDFSLGKYPIDPNETMTPPSKKRKEKLLGTPPKLKKTCLLNEHGKEFRDTSPSIRSSSFPSVRELSSEGSAGSGHPGAQDLPLQAEGRVSPTQAEGEDALPLVNQEPSPSGKKETLLPPEDEETGKGASPPSDLPAPFSGKEAQSWGTTEPLQGDDKAPGYDSTLLDLVDNLSSEERLGESIFLITFLGPCDERIPIIDQAATFWSNNFDDQKNPIKMIRWCQDPCRGDWPPDIIKETEKHAQKGFFNEFFGYCINEFSEGTPIAKIMRFYTSLIKLAPAGSSGKMYHPKDCVFFDYSWKSPNNDSQVEHAKILEDQKVIHKVFGMQSPDIYNQQILLACNARIKTEDLLGISYEEMVDMCKESPPGISFHHWSIFLTAEPLAREEICLAGCWNHALGFRTGKAEGLCPQTLWLYSRWIPLEAERVRKEGTTHTLLTPERVLGPRSIEWVYGRKPAGYREYHKHVYEHRTRGAGSLVTDELGYPIWSFEDTLNSRDDWEDQATSTPRGYNQEGKGHYDEWTAPPWLNPRTQEIARNVKFYENDGLALASNLDQGLPGADWYREVARWGITMCPVEHRTAWLVFRDQEENKKRKMLQVGRGISPTVDRTTKERIRNFIFKWKMKTAGEHLVRENKFAQNSPRPFTSITEIPGEWAGLGISRLDEPWLQSPEININSPGVVLYAAPRFGSEISHPSEPRKRYQEHMQSRSLARDPCATLMRVTHGKAAGGEILEISTIWKEPQLPNGWGRELREVYTQCYLTLNGKIAEKIGGWDAVRRRFTIFQGTHLTSKENPAYLIQDLDLSTPELREGNRKLLHSLLPSKWRGKMIRTIFWYEIKGTSPQGKEAEPSSPSGDPGAGSGSREGDAPGEGGESNTPKTQEGKGKGGTGSSPSPLLKTTGGNGDGSLKHVYDPFHPQFRADLFSPEKSLSDLIYREGIPPERKGSLPIDKKDFISGDDNVVPDAISRAPTNGENAEDLFPTWRDLAPIPRSSAESQEILDKIQNMIAFIKSEPGFPRAGYPNLVPALRFLYTKTKAEMEGREIPPPLAFLGKIEEEISVIFEGGKNPEEILRSMQMREKTPEEILRMKGPGIFSEKPSPELEKIRYVSDFSRVSVPEVASSCPSDTSPPAAILQPFLQQGRGQKSGDDTLGDNTLIAEKVATGGVPSRQDNDSPPHPVEENRCELGRPLCSDVPRSIEEGTSPQNPANTPSDSSSEEIKAPGEGTGGIESVPSLDPPFPELEEILAKLSIKSHPSLRSPGGRPECTLAEAGLIYHEKKGTRGPVPRAPGREAMDPCSWKWNFRIESYNLGGLASTLKDRWKDLAQLFVCKPDLLVLQELMMNDEKARVLLPKLLWIAVAYGYETRILTPRDSSKNGIAIFWRKDGPAPTHIWALAELEKDEIKAGRIVAIQFPFFRAYCTYAVNSENKLDIALSFFRDLLKEIEHCVTFEIPVALVGDINISLEHHPDMNGKPSTEPELQGVFKKLRQLGLKDSFSHYMEKAEIPTKGHFSAFYNSGSHCRKNIGLRIDQIWLCKQLQGFTSYAGIAYEIRRPTGDHCAIWTDLHIPYPGTVGSLSFDDEEYNFSEYDGTENLWQGLDPQDAACASASQLQCDLPILANADSVRIPLYNIRLEDGGVSHVILANRSGVRECFDICKSSLRVDCAGIELNFEFEHGTQEVDWSKPWRELKRYVLGRAEHIKGVILKQKPRFVVIHCRDARHRAPCFSVCLDIVANRVTRDESRQRLDELRPTNECVWNSVELYIESHVLINGKEDPSTTPMAIEGPNTVVPDPGNDDETDPTCEVEGGGKVSEAYPSPGNKEEVATSSGPCWSYARLEDGTTELCWSGSVFNHETAFLHDAIRDCLRQPKGIVKKILARTYILYAVDFCRITCPCGKAVPVGLPVRTGLNEIFHKAWLRICNMDSSSFSVTMKSIKELAYDVTFPSELFSNLVALPDGRGVFNFPTSSGTITVSKQKIEWDSQIDPIKAHASISPSGIACLEYEDTTKKDPPAGMFCAVGPVPIKALPDTLIGQDSEYLAHNNRGGPTGRNDGLALGEAIMKDINAQITSPDPTGSPQRGKGKTLVLYPLPLLSQDVLHRKEELLDQKGIKASPDLYDYFPEIDEIFPCTLSPSGFEGEVALVSPSITAPVPDPRERGLARIPGYS